MGSREEHAVDCRLIVAFDQELLSFKVLLHNETALSELSEENLIPAIVDMVVHILLAAIPKAYTLAATEKVKYVATEVIRSLGSLIDHVGEYVHFHLKIVQFILILLIIFDRGKFNQLLSLGIYVLI